MRQAEWWISDTLEPYEAAVARMEARVGEIVSGEAGDAVWLLEHPALYTAGTSAKREDLLDPGGLPVYPSGRGGQYTYHGPGQRIGYLMRDLRPHGRDLKAHVRALEQWLIDTLARFNVLGERRRDRVGVWVHGKAGRDDKIAAIGVRVRHWVSFHGVSINIDPELRHFEGIVPCGIREHGVTSLLELGVPVTVAEVDIELQKTFRQNFP